MWLMKKLKRLLGDKIPQAKEIYRRLFGEGGRRGVSSLGSLTTFGTNAREPLFDTQLCTRGFEASDCVLGLAKEHCPMTNNQ